MKDLSSLWKPATDIKPEELIGKQCRWKVSKMPVIILAVKGSIVRYSDHGFEYSDADISNFEYLDESPEAVNGLLKGLYKSEVNNVGNRPQNEGWYTTDIGELYYYPQSNRWKDIAGEYKFPTNYFESI